MTLVRPLRFCFSLIALFFQLALEMRFWSSANRQQQQQIDLCVYCSLLLFFAWNLRPGSWRFISFINRRKQYEMRIAPVVFFFFFFYIFLPWFIKLGEVLQCWWWRRWLPKMEGLRVVPRERCWLLDHVCGFVIHVPTGREGNNKNEHRDLITKYLYWMSPLVSNAIVNCYPQMPYFAFVTICKDRMSPVLE